MIDLDRLRSDAIEVLRVNDTGRFVKPSQRLYPWQWNWDSAFVVIGLSGVEPERARLGHARPSASTAARPCAANHLTIRASPVLMAQLLGTTSRP